MPVPTFLLTQINPPRVKLYLRRFTHGEYDDPDPAYHVDDRPDRIACPAAEPTGDHGYRRGHDSSITHGRVRGNYIDTVEVRLNKDGTLPVYPKKFARDKRWPTVCSECGEPFPKEAIRQVNQDLLYIRSDTGEETTIRDAPDGAMWYADWMGIDRWKGPDGRCLMARTPGGHDWMIDSVAKNCTLPDDVNHRCWMRHGTPPNISVDKNPEPPFDHTCAAGAGSIQAGNYHGFLTNGAFT